MSQCVSCPYATLWVGGWLCLHTSLLRLRFGLWRGLRLELGLGRIRRELGLRLGSSERGWLETVGQCSNSIPQPPSVGPWGGWVPLGPPVVNYVDGWLRVRRTAPFLRQQDNLLRKRTQLHVPDSLCRPSSCVGVARQVAEQPQQPPLPTFAPAPEPRPPNFPKLTTTIAHGPLT